MKNFILMLLTCCGLTPLMAQPGSADYIVEDSVMIRTRSGVVLSAVVVHPKNIKAPLPVALMFFLYANTARSISEARYAAEQGYVGVVADVRGKRLSPVTDIRPYEREAEDVYEVIDWISRQSWCNGKIGMYGGSYSGFAQWASLKHRQHPALKTIVPYVAPIPGMGLPMENNIFLNANYGWAFYVGNNKYLDTTTYNNNQRWQTMKNRWYASGAPYAKIDSVDGTPNPWLQTWLQHPDFDSYWQQMIPWGKEYTYIDIPVLCIDGYYNDGQVSGLHYIRELTKYNPHPDYYVVLGPYDHFGAQRGGQPIMRGYAVDSVALFSTKTLTFQWFDYIMKGGSKPAMLKDHINYEIMGANSWGHAPSLDKMYQYQWKLYPNMDKTGPFYGLTPKTPTQHRYLDQQVDFTDRNTSSDYAYPYPIIQDTVQSNGFFFQSAPLEKELVLNGAFNGELLVTINKRDMDFSVVLYEVTPEGKYFELSYFLGRASYLNSPSYRQLLKPGRQERLHFARTKVVSKLLHKGSRILVVVNVNKSRNEEINYGTGKPVSQESVRDAGLPLEVRWWEGSWVSLPVSEE